MLEEQAPQCGYCYNGMIVKAAELLSKNPRPDDAQIKTSMNGHLCRCGTYPSASIARGGPQVRTAAAEARLALVEMAAKRLAVAANSLAVSKGVVSTADGARRVTYGELIGDRRFDLAFTGSAPVKKPAD